MAEQPKDQPKVPPPPKAGGELNYVVISDSTEAVPKAVSTDSLDTLKEGLHKSLLEAKRGWVYVFIDGKRCRVSQPIQVFVLELPGGGAAELRGPAPAFEDDGSFRCLEQQ